MSARMQASLASRAQRRTAPDPAPEIAPLMHTLPAELLTREVRVLVVGCGGTGSEIASGLPFLHQAMRAHGHPAGLRILLMDGDVVSPTNTVRQAFAPGDVGHPKATLLANRLNAFWGLKARAIPRHLEPAAHAPRSEQGYPQGLGADVVIGCVDSRAARAVIRERIDACDGVLWKTQRPRYWLDLGNDAATGQFVLGQPKGAPDAGGPSRLPCVDELYPETVDGDADGDDTRPSCSAVEALTRQEPFVNRVLAGQALAMLARLFRYGELAYHGAYVNLATGRTISLSVAPEQWDRIRSMSQRPRRRIRRRTTTGE